MHKFNTIEPIIQDIKILVNSLLMPHSPLDRIIVVCCNRLLALKDAADLNKAVDEIYAAFDYVHECMIKLKRLLGKIKV